uniref:Uncharacterized protein n=1 Tax=Panagrolaimus sp. PS1159 TaxID=55785 RepID=A0AC35G3D8_9BILA
MDKSMADGNFDLLTEIKEKILVETLQKAEKENPIKNSIAKYQSVAKILTDASTLKTVLQSIIKKANAKLIGEIQAMEELERNEQEKKAQMYLSVSGHKELPNLDDPSLVKEEVIESREQTLIQLKEKMSQLM